MGNLRANRNAKVMKICESPIVLQLQKTKKAV